MFSEDIHISQISGGMRRLAVCGGFFLICCVIGWTIASQTVKPLIAVSFFPMAFVFMQALRNWRWGLMTVAVWFVVVDVIRKMMGGSRTPLVITDGLVAVLFCLFFLQYFVFKDKTAVAFIPKSILLVLAGFGYIVFVQALDPEIPNLFMRVAGVRAYLFYIPTIMLGLFFLRSEDDLKWLYRALLFLALPVILISFYQAVAGPSALGAAMTSMEHKVHSYGFYVFDLIPSTFASSKRYGRFLFLVYPFLYGLLVYYKKRRVVKLGLVVLFVAGSVISGAREALVILVLFHLFFWIFSSKRQIKQSQKVLTGVIAAILIWQFVLGFEFQSITEKNYRIRSILSNQEEWSARIKDYLYDPFLNIKIEDSNSSVNSLFGHGVGTFGQEATVITGPSYVIHGRAQLYSKDSGITKLIAELGSVGFFYFVIMYLFILRVLWKSVKRLKNQEIFVVGLSIFFIPLGWLMLFMKAHSVISDGMMSFGLWFSIGIILSLRHYAEGGSFPVVENKERG